MTDDHLLQYESFHDPLFLRTNQLSERSVLEYFCNSKFFDQNSLNQRRRRGVHVPSDADGIEYKLVQANAAGRDRLPVPFGTPYNYPNQFGIFIILRVKKTGLNETPQRVYYCSAGVIYQAPSLASVIIFRLQHACKELYKAIELLEGMLQWSILSGYHWKANLDLEKTLAAVNGEGTTEESDEEEEGSTVSSDSSSSSNWTDSGDSSSDESSDEAVRFTLDREMIPPGIRLSERRIRKKDGRGGVSVLFESRGLAHTHEVVDLAFRQLYFSSRRLGDIFEDEIARRQKEELERRNIFQRYHQIIESLQNKLIGSVQPPPDSYWNIKVTDDAQPTTPSQPPSARDS